MMSNISNCTEVQEDNFSLEEVQLRRYPCFSPKSHSILTIESVDSLETQKENFNSESSPDKLIPISIHSDLSTIAPIENKRIRGEDGNQAKKHLASKDLRRLSGKFSSILLLSNLVTPSGMLGFHSVMSKNYVELFRIHGSKPIFKGFYPVI